MGHLLSSVNPEVAQRLQEEGDAGVRKPLITPSAAEAITDPAKPYAPAKPLAMVQPHEPEYTCDRIPPVGCVVTYHARPGQGRAGKTEFPSVVMHCDEKGRAELAVIFSADDLAEFEKVPYRSETIPWPAWSFIPSPDVVDFASKFSTVLGIVERLNSRVEAQETMFLKRLEALEARKVDLSPITSRLDALEGRPPSEKPKKG
jgi:hypothetical protein